MEETTRAYINTKGLLVAEITDKKNQVKRGYFTIRGSNYILLTFDTIWHIYTYKLKNIKKMKILTNNLEMKGE